MNEFPQSKGHNASDRNGCEQKRQPFHQEDSPSGPRERADIGNGAVPESVKWSRGNPDLPSYVVQTSLQSGNARPSCPVVVPDYVPGVVHVKLQRDNGKGPCLMVGVGDMPVKGAEEPMVRIRMTAATVAPAVDAPPYEHNKSDDNTQRAFHKGHVLFVIDCCENPICGRVIRLALGRNAASCEMPKAHMHEFVLECPGCGAQGKFACHMFVGSMGRIDNGMRKMQWPILLSSAKGRAHCPRQEVHGRPQPWIGSQVEFYMSQFAAASKRDSFSIYAEVGQRGCPEDFHYFPGEKDVPSSDFDTTVELIGIQVFQDEVLKRPQESVLALGCYVDDCLVYMLHHMPDWRCHPRQGTVSYFAHRYRPAFISNAAKDCRRNCISPLVAFIFLAEPGLHNVQDTLATEDQT